MLRTPNDGHSGERAQRVQLLGYLAVSRPIVALAMGFRVVGVTVRRSVGPTAELVDRSQRATGNRVRLMGELARYSGPPAALLHIRALRRTGQRARNCTF